MHFTHLSERTTIMRRPLLVLAAIAAAGLMSAASLSWACFMVSPQPVQVWMDHINVEITDQVAVKTYECTFLNPNPQAVIGGACFMELEPGAQIDDMSVLVDGVETKAEILDVKKAKEVFNDIIKNGGSPALLEYYGNQLIRTRVPKVPAGGTVTVKLTYTTVLQKKGDVVRLQLLNTNPKAWASEMIQPGPKPRPIPGPVPRPLPLGKPQIKRAPPAVGGGGVAGGRPPVVGRPIIFPVPIRPGWVRPLKSASVTIKIRSQHPIKNLYSPTHKVKIEEDKDWDVVISWAQKEYTPKDAFVFYYQVADDKIGASLLAHRELGEEGHFMLMLSPTIGGGVGQVSDSDILPKDIVFCVDTSGSMLEGNKMEQARAALKYCVENLRPDDRFNIVDFSTGVRAFRKDQLVTASAENLSSAQRYVAKLHSRGGTAIKDALESSLALLGESDRLKMIIFTTDGLPTIGERKPEAILKAVDKANKNDVRLFVFGEGFNVNTKLLDFLALNHRGEADYVLPDEDIAKRISKFYDRVGSPIMTDLKIEIDGVRVKDVHPTQVADIYRGEQVIIYGRYDGSGKHKVKLTGTFKGETRSLEYEVDFPEYSEDDKSSFVPRLWAGKKVDFLLSELRKSEKEDPELVEEITYLAKRFGIITPYTSYLMAEDIVHQQPGRGQQIFLGALKAANAPAAQISAEKKADQVRVAKDLSDARRSSGKGAARALFEEADKAMARSGRNVSALTQMRYIGARTFYHSRDAWYDSVFDVAKDEKNLTTVKLGTDEYFGLLKQDARLAKYLALGEVVIKVKGRWYRITAGAAK